MLAAELESPGINATLVKTIDSSQFGNIPMSNSLLASGAAMDASYIDRQAERPKRAGANESILSEFRRQEKPLRFAGIFP